MKDITTKKIVKVKCHPQLTVQCQQWKHQWSVCSMSRMEIQVQCVQCQQWKHQCSVFNVNNGKTSTVCEIYSNLTIKTPERRHWHRHGDFIVKSEQILPFVLVLPLLILNKKTPLLILDKKVFIAGVLLLISGNVSE